jgi:tungstate transport system permease protein
MTTAIALETSKGDLALALGLGMVLITLSVAVSAAAFLMARAWSKMIGNAPPVGRRRR